MSNNVILVPGKLKPFQYGTPLADSSDIVSDYNNPDGEDLAAEGGVLKLKNKAYVPNDFSGMGRVYLRKNMINASLHFADIISDLPSTETDVLFGSCDEIVYETTNNRFLAVKHTSEGKKYYPNYQFTDSDAYSNPDDKHVYVCDANAKLYTWESDTLTETTTLMDKNVLTQDMINNPNTIYIIQYDYDIVDKEDTTTTNNLTIGGEYYSYKPITIEDNQTYRALNDCVFVDYHHNSLIGSVLVTGENESQDFAIAKKSSAASGVPVSYYSPNGTITIPAGCTLKFEGGSLKNGTIVGNSTFINSDRTCFDNVGLSGTFGNETGHIKWFKQTTDIAKQLDSLINKFGKIVLEYGGEVSSELNQITNNTEIDGLNNIVKPVNKIRYLFWTGDAGKDRSNDIVVKNLVVDYNSGTGFVNDTYKAFSIATKGLISFDNVEVKNYVNALGEQSSFGGIVLYPRTETRIKVQNCKFNNLISGSDGVEVTGWGVCNGIVVTSYLMSEGETCGDVDINNCYFNFIQNKLYNTGEYVRDDAGGIFIETYGHNAHSCTVRNCYFKNVAKRNIKIQGDGAVCENLYIDYDTTVVPATALLFAIGTEFSKDLVIRNVYVKNYPATFFKSSTGDNCTLDNISCAPDANVKELMRLSERTNYNYRILNCFWKGYVLTLGVFREDQKTAEFTGVPTTGIVIENCDFNRFPSNDSDNNCFIFVDYDNNQNIAAFNAEVRINNTSVYCWRLLNNNGLKKLEIKNSQLNFLQQDNLSVVNKNLSYLLLEDCAISTKLTYSGASDKYFMTLPAGSTIKNCKFSEQAESGTYTSVLYFINDKEVAVTTTSNVRTTISNTLINVTCAYDIYYTRTETMPDFVVENSKFYRMRFANNMKQITISNCIWSSTAQYDILADSPAVSDFKIIKNDTVGALPSNIYPYIRNNKSGTWADKPVSPEVGWDYFCTDKQTTEGGQNGIMIYYKGTNVWVDALGRVIS